MKHKLHTLLNLFIKLNQNGSYGLFTLPDLDLFTLLDLDSDWDSDSDSKSNGHIALCRSFHTVRSQIRIPITTANWRNLIVCTRVLLRQRKWVNTVRAHSAAHSIPGSSPTNSCTITLSKGFSCNTGRQKDKKCCTKDESEESIANRQEGMQVRNPFWIWKQTLEVRNRGITGPTKRPYGLQIFKKTPLTHFVPIAGSSIACTPTDADCSRTRCSPGQVAMVTGEKPDCDCECQTGKNIRRVFDRFLAVADPGFPGGCQPHRWDSDLLFIKFYTENSIKMNEIGPRRVRESLGSANAHANSLVYPLQLTWILLCLYFIDRKFRSPIILTDGVKAIHKNPTVHGTTKVIWK